MDITYRPLTRDDLETLLVWRNDPEVTRHLASRETTAQRLLEWYDSLDPANECARAILADGRFIGYGALKGTDAVNGCTEVGLVIGDKDYWGRGIGTAAAREFARCAFEEIGLHRVLAVASENNPASIRCFLSAGYQEEGRLRESRYGPEGHYDLVLMSILRTEWRDTAVAEAAGHDARPTRQSATLTREPERGAVHEQP